MSAIDLRRQVRLGPNFSLLKEAGGTGRVDGYSPGLWFPSVASGDNSAILRGQVVKSIQSIGPAFVCTPTTAVTNVPVGVALEDIAQNNVSGAIAYAGAPVLVLTTGTIAVHDRLYTSGTTGRATATFTAGATPIGMSLNATSGTSSVWALLSGLGGGSGADHGGLSGLADDDHTQYLLRSIVDAKGDLVAATAADTLARLAVGTNGQTLLADSAEATGLRWGAAPTSVSVKEEDDSPSVVADTIKVARNSLADLGGGDVYLSEAPIIVIGEQGPNGDGSTTLWTLTNYAEAETVAPYINGTRTFGFTHSGDQVTFTAAPANLATVYFDYLAEAA